jgi:hypothetical protein
MSESSPSLLSLDEPALKAATTPPPPPQPGEHNMRLRSQGPEPPRSTLDAHLYRHIHTHLDEEDFPNVATPVRTPRRILHGTARPLFQNLLGLAPILGPPQRMAWLLRIPLEDAPRPPRSRPLPRPHFFPLVDVPRPTMTLRLSWILSSAPLHLQSLPSPAGIPRVPHLTHL